MNGMQRGRCFVHFLRRACHVVAGGLDLHEGFVNGGLGIGIGIAEEFVAKIAKKGGRKNAYGVSRWQTDITKTTMMRCVQ